MYEAVWRPIEVLADLDVHPAVIAAAVHEHAATGWPATPLAFTADRF